MISEPAEINLSRRAIIKVVKSGLLFWDHGMTSDRHLQSRLVDKASTGMPDMLLLDAGDWKYWLGMQLKFSVAMGEALFRSASLIISRSALAGDPRTKVIRAEWERREESENRSHAQPHWHVYSSELEHGAGRPTARFHLAMASGWHLGEVDSHYREPSPENLAGWIEQCAQYTRGQLVLLAS